MTALLNATNSEKFREALDWAVFGLGAVSLSVAVFATLATKVNLIG